MFDADVFHLTDLRSFSDFFHEAFHLICLDPVLAEKTEFQRSEYDLPALFEEVFVQQMMWLTVFDEDLELMVVDFCFRWFTSLEDAAPERQSPAPQSSREERDLQSFAENFSSIVIGILCGFAARKEPLDSKRITRRDEFVPHFWDLLPSLAKAVAFLDVCLDTSIPFIENKTLLTEESREKIRAVFGQIYDGLLLKLSPIWQRAVDVFEGFVRDVARETKAPAGADPWKSYRDERDRIEREAVRPIMMSDDSEHFIPLSGCRLHNEVGQAVDGSLLVLCILRGYLRYTYFWSETQPATGQIERILLRSHTNDDKTSKKPHFLPDVCYANFLLDRTATLPFSCSPSARRRRLGIDTCVIKMLWDVASRQRRRRLRTLLSLCDWGKSQQ